MEIKEIRIPDGEVVSLIEEMPSPSHIFLGKGAKLFHYRFAGSDITVEVGEGGFYEGFLLECNSKSSKTLIKLNGENSSSSNNLVYLANETLNIEVDFRVHHLANNTLSEQQARGVATDKAIASFTGLIEVGAEIKAITGNQFHKALLLSDDAEIKSLPELAIASEDVKCTHGSSIGELDENALFYIIVQILFVNQKYPIKSGVGFLTGLRLFSVENCENC